MTEQRTIIETETPGWYEDPQTGKKTRKQDGDRVMSMEQYRREVQAANDEAAVADNGKPTETASSKAADRNRKSAVDNKSKETHTLSSGKVVTGAVATIRCAHIDGKDHLKSYDELTPAEKRQACGKERIIKVQDQFQVKRCLDHQQGHRNFLRRLGNQRKREQREAAKQA